MGRAFWVCAVSTGLIYVVGPSGVGKDSLLNWLRAHVRSMKVAPALHFARRTVTRAQGNSNEDHESVDIETFTQLVSSRAFALQWEAHGLHYGVRHTEVIGRSGWVMVNGSRAYLEQARALFAGLTALHVCAPEAEVHARLAARQRETPAQVQARMLRASAADVAPAPSDLAIVNAGTLDATAAELCELLQAHTGLQLTNPV